ncbi:hypothetical protein GA0115252_16714 [Streptomyces sp. DfronAA-171]|nr:hypothetical protein GA0115252_16714 [Streptomyces sp. DfronAA-171]
MICACTVQLGYSPRSIASRRSRWCESGSAPASLAASSAVSVLMPWSVLKWYLTQKISPAALFHWYVCEP